MNEWIMANLGLVVTALVVALGCFGVMFGLCWAACAVSGHIDEVQQELDQE